MLIAHLYRFLHRLPAAFSGNPEPSFLTYGPSMLPAIGLSPSLFLTERISTRFGKLAQGDIIVLRNPQNPRRTNSKRLVGLEGDTITYVSSSENSDMHETVVATFGYKVITHIIATILDILVQFLMALLRVSYFGGYGHLKILDRSGKNDLKISIIGLAQHILRPKTNYNMRSIMLKIIFLMIR
ncbi:mitochondrial ATP-independent inner membrane protease subunit 1b-like isoform X2 [Cicer arietinum]|uniref:mitochondrial ATP-independent inner membrane protease subunit 1b-like isoform X2 n=1 Tax=Cicer arietinum TaxID=3827 RepID=UPI003CC5F228